MSLNALVLNCSLKPSHQHSHTQHLADRVMDVLEQLGVTTSSIRLADKVIRWGITDDAGDDDQWPEVLERIRACDILIIASPIWMGTLCSLGQLALERLNGSPTDEDTGAPVLTGKVCGFVITGNEDGAHAAVRSAMLSVSHLGATLPPLSDCYWVGEAGPGPSYGDKGIGLNHTYTNKTILYAAHHLAAFAKLLKEHPVELDLKLLDRAAKERRVEAIRAAIG